MCEIYIIFSNDWKDCCDFSEGMMLELYYAEAFGDKVSQNNGYYVGKRYMNLTIAMWKQDIEIGYLLKSELYNDETFPHWWLDKIFKIH